MKIEPQNEHRWLQQLVGDWTFETICDRGPGQPESRQTGRETVRSLGGLWTIGEGEMPDGGSDQSIMTLGYDPAKKRFVGTFVASMMACLWVYDGELDASQKTLTLDTEGPNYHGEGTSKYQDIIEMVSPDHRILRSQFQGPDGNWVPFMTANYHRKRDFESNLDPQLGERS